MSFTHLDGDSFCVGTLYDPSKIAEFDSAHTKAEGVWYGAYDWRIRQPFVLTDEPEWKVVSINMGGLTLPTAGFYTYSLDNSIHVVISCMFGYVPRSARVEIPFDRLQDVNHRDTITTESDLFLGLIIYDAYYPGIPKVWPLRCLDSYHQFEENYPIPTAVQDANYRVSDKFFLTVGNNVDWAMRGVYLTGPFLEDLEEQAQRRALNDYLSTHQEAIVNDMSRGIELNEPILATDALRYKRINKFDNIHNADRIRPRCYLSTIGGIYTTRYVDHPLFTFFPFTTLPGLLYEADAMSSLNNVIVHILFHGTLTYINNLLMSPATSSTLLAWGTLKSLSMFFYPGYPYFNSVRYGNKDYELMIYMNQPTESLRDDYCVVPYMQEYSSQDIYVSDPPTPNFSIFAEMYMMFEGLVMGRSRPVDITQSDTDHYWYANKASVQITSIDITLKKTQSGVADCSGIGSPCTTNVKKVNEFTHVDYSKSTLNQALFFAEGQWGRTVTVADDLERPVLMSICSLNLLNVLCETIIDRIKKKEKSKNIVATTYLLVQAGESIHLSHNPFKSLNGTRSFKRIYRLYYTDFHKDSSRLFVYNMLANTEGLFSQTLLKETIILNDASILFDKIKDNDTVLDVKGDIVHGFDVSIMLESGATKTIHLDWKNDITLITDLEQVWSRTYTGYGVFPHLVELENGELLFHDDSSLIIYNPEKNSAESLPLPDLAGHIPSILPDKTLLAIYKYVKGQGQQTP